MDWVRGAHIINYINYMKLAMNLQINSNKKWRSELMMTGMTNRWISRRKRLWRMIMWFPTLRTMGVCTFTICLESRIWSLNGIWMNHHHHHSWSQFFFFLGNPQKRKRNKKNLYWINHFEYKVWEYLLLMRNSHLENCESGKRDELRLKLVIVLDFQFIDVTLYDSISFA